MAKQLIFKPNEEELNYIYENIDNWTAWCRTNIEKERKGKEYGNEILSRISTFLIILVIGVLISFLSLIVQAHSGVIFGMMLLGSILVIYGTYSIIGVYKYG